MNENFNGKIIYQPHHLCHAASSILCSNFEKGICLSFDASEISLQQKYLNLKIIK